MNHATGLMSMAVTSQPRRMASRGIAPPPAKGSSTLGRTAAVSLANLLPEPLKVGAILASPMEDAADRLLLHFLDHTAVYTLALDLLDHAAGHAIKDCPSVVSGSPGSRETDVAISAARDAARGRRAGQMCSVEMWPCRTFFSCTESSDTSFSGNAHFDQALVVVGGHGVFSLTPLAVHISPMN